MSPINFKNNKDVYNGAVAKANEHTDRRYNSTQTIIYAVLIVVILVFIQIIIDSFRFSSVTYKEYESRIEERSVLLNENKDLLNEIKSNQDKIIDRLEKQTKGSH